MNMNTNTLSNIRIIFFSQNFLLTLTSEDGFDNLIGLHHRHATLLTQHNPHLWEYQLNNREFWGKSELMNVTFLIRH